MERRQHSRQVRIAPRQLAANDPTDTRQQVAAMPFCRSSDSVAPKGDSMQHKSVPLLIRAPMTKASLVKAHVSLRRSDATDTGRILRTDGGRSATRRNG